MADLINLNRARKARERAQKAATADANRVVHGTPKALKTLSKARKDKAEQSHSGHRLEKNDPDN